MNKTETTQPEISIVSPVYRAEKLVAELVARCCAAVEGMGVSYEIVLVNDASPDASWQAIAAQCAANQYVKGLDLSRNFGQHYAITAGLRYAAGRWVVVMDCDLQDRPEEIPNLYRKAQEGFDIVYARRAQRQDTWLKRQSSNLFRMVYDWLSGNHSDNAIANFGIYSQDVIRHYNTMPEVSRSFGSLVRYLGFRSTAIDVQHSARAEGHTTYTLHKLLKLSFDVILSNSNKPLRMAVGLGLAMSGVSFMLAAYNIVARMVGIISVQGYTTTIFSIWFVGGLLLFVMGILGLYISKIFDQVKGRPLFVVRQALNVDEADR
ncbi:MAG: glycosyltransferase family 2 protein [Bacteroidales bacterium]|nr:glycosyltransferase family 2 protein [Bacteroidales bacterium]